MARAVGFYTKRRGRKKTVHPITPRRRTIRKVSMRDVKRIQSGRSKRAKATDAALRAKVKPTDQWAKDPSRADIEGVDLPRELSLAEREDVWRAAITEDRYGRRGPGAQRVYEEYPAEYKDVIARLAEIHKVFPRQDYMISFEGIDEIAVEPRKYMSRDDWLAKNEQARKAGFVYVRGHGWIRRVDAI